MIFYTGSALSKKIIESTMKHEMIFIGENPHWNKRINSAVEELMIELSKATDFKIYAKESLYCYHPFMELDSQNADDSPIIPGKITEYNKSVEINERIIATAIDIAHSIKHSTNLVNAFIQKHIAEISNASSKKRISDLSLKLVGNDDPIDKNHIIRDLKRTTASCRSEIDEISYEELSFYYDLLIVSLQITDLSIKSQDDLRNKWYIETINRALFRNGLKILCHVGLPHAYKAYINEDDYYTGKTPEAKYFNDRNTYATVYSIQIRPFHLGNNCEVLKQIKDPIEKKAYDHLGKGKSVFVDLHEYNNQDDNVGIEKYYLNGDYQFDGIIYVYDKDDA